MRILVTGGAGFLGINLIRYLLARAHSIRSLDIAAFDYPERARVEVVDGDVRDRDTVGRAISGIDAVVHCAAALPRAKPLDILSTSVDGTRNLLESAAREHVARLVFISSTAVYGVPDHHPVREDDRLRGVGPYGNAKIEAERLCESARAQGSCVPILRPKTFVGPERLGVFALLYDWAADGRDFPVIGSGNNRYQLLDVEDLCVAIGLALTHDDDRVNDTFNVGAAEFGTMRDNIQAVLDRAGLGGRVRSLPAAPAVALLALLERLHLSPLYEWIYATAGTDSFVSIDRIQSRLGFQPRYSNRAALERNFEWYLAHRDSFRGASGISHRVAWEPGILRLAKLFF